MRPSPSGWTTAHAACNGRAGQSLGHTCIVLNPFGRSPVGAQMIARRQETAALRNLNPVYVRFGSITSDLTTDEFVGCPLHLPSLPSFGTAAMEPYMFRPVVWLYQAQGGTPK